MRFLILMAVLLVTSCTSEASEKSKNHGRIVFVAWECSKYAGMAKDNENSDKLFSLGLESGRTFIQQVQDNDIDEKYIRENVPVGTSMVIFDGGPSPDFILGRLHQSVSDYAYDRVVKEDSNGNPLEIEKWNMDENLKASIARGYFNSSNCELLL